LTIALEGALPDASPIPSSILVMSRPVKLVTMPINPMMKL
jgi:hypothetical protein